MLKISRESEINLINVLIDHDIISGKDLPNIKKVSSEKNSSQIDAVFELKLTDEQMDEIEKILPVGWAFGDRYSVGQWVGPEKYC